MTDDALGYAPKPPLRRRRVVRRWCALVLALAVVAVGWRWGGPWWAQGRYLYDQHRAMTYVLPLDRVVFDNDPVTARALVRTNRAYRPLPGPLFNPPWYPSPPSTWHPPAIHFHPAFDRLVITTVHYAGVVFAHTRRAPAGAERLVCVTLGCSAFSPEGTTVGLHADAFIPAGWRRGASLSRATLWSALAIPVKGEQRVRLFAGQADPVDASHFTIGYEIDGEPGTIDGWLRDHGNLASPSSELRRAKAVELVIRDGPALSPPEDDEGVN